jgi:hypothetical protein
MVVKIMAEGRSAIIENGRDTATTPLRRSALGTAIITKGADLVGCRFW